MLSNLTADPPPCTTTISLLIFMVDFSFLQVFEAKETGFGTPADLPSIPLGSLNKLQVPPFNRGPPNSGSPLTCRNLMLSKCSYRIGYGDFSGALP